MKKLTVMLFALMLAASMSMAAFAAGQQTQGEPAPHGQTTQKKHKKSRKKKTSHKHQKQGTSPTTTPPPQ